MERIGSALASTSDGAPCTPAIVTPRPVAGLVTKRVLVMDFLRGVPLSRAVEAMEARGIEPDSPEAQLFGRKLLGSLTAAFGRTILEGGFFHADPHPGSASRLSPRAAPAREPHTRRLTIRLSPALRAVQRCTALYGAPTARRAHIALRAPADIFVLDDGRIGLIDFGQVKQIGARASTTLARVMVALAERTSDADPVQLDRIGELALELGVRLKADAPREGPAATAIWLFDGSVSSLPGGFDVNELSPNSPVRVLKSFPQV